ncbi:LysR family transcriptional regulator [Ruminococcus sp. Marseille-P6503]|uniref:LysR family transcriptional regulator n=1 Tax=Ruminococcus sp. Marseille-P6503 TaxID=2364796 RepID=UPI000F533FB5|nr:LysR family transcriptional regulator [Ruminococcus sp. Marseille-P6503]
MNTVQLECFLAVVEHLNFSKAAESINITQPAVSHQINSLEDELGVKLFTRTSKSVSLTREGIQFISDAEAIMKIAMTSRERLTRSRAEKPVRIGIGCHNQAELDMLPPILKKLSEIYPRLLPSIHVVPFRSLDNMLSDEKIQVMMAFTEKPEDENSSVYTELCRCPIMCICSKDYPLASLSSVDVNKISGKAILIERHKCSNIVFKNQSRIVTNNSADSIYYCDSYETGIAMVKSGTGFMLFPKLPNMRDPELSFIPVTDTKPASFGLFYKTAHGNPVLKGFISSALEIHSPGSQRA